MATDNGRTFDPTPYITEQRGRKHLDLKWRLIWLRTEHPDAEITTEEISSGDDWVKFRARISIPSGGSATGYARANKEDTPVAWYEKAEAAAVARALFYLGYGTQFASELEDEVDAPAAPAEAPIEFPRPGPRPVRETTPVSGRAEVPRARSGSNWTGFWSAVREYRRLHPEFDEVTVVGRDPSKRMTAEEAMRRFREATGQHGQEN